MTTFLPYRVDRCCIYRRMSLFPKKCISQRDGLHTAPIPRIDNLIGQGLDLAIQAEQEATYECLTST